MSDSNYTDVQERFEWTEFYEKLFKHRQIENPGLTREEYDRAIVQPRMRERARKEAERRRQKTQEYAGPLPKREVKVIEVKEPAEEITAPEVKEEAPEKKEERHNKGDILWAFREVIAADQAAATENKADEQEKETADMVSDDADNLPGSVLDQESEELPGKPVVMESVRSEPFIEKAAAETEMDNQEKPKAVWKVDYFAKEEPVPVEDDEMDYSAIGEEPGPPEQEEAELDAGLSDMPSDTLLPSQKAFAYMKHLEAISRLTGVGPTDIISSNGAARTVRRYLRLTNLIPEMLELIDEGILPVNSGVELSYIDEDGQKDLVGMIIADGGIKIKEAKKIREDYQRIRNGGFDMMDNMSMEEVRESQKERLAAFGKAMETSAMKENSARDSHGAIRSNGDTGHDSSENQ